MPLVLAISGFVSVMVAWATYLATIPKGTMPARPIGHLLLQVGGVGLAIAGIAVWMRDGGASGAAVIPSAAVAIMMGLFFPFLLLFRKTPVGNIKVKLGDTLLPFASQTSDGSSFHSDSLAGRRSLLKFFRGGW